MKTHHAPNKKTALTTGVLKISIATAACLLFIKFLTGFLTHSMAIMASALDSAMDVATSTVNLIAAKEASKPPDEDHAYGHGKIESLAGLFQSLLIGFSGVMLVVESVKRLVQGTYIARLDIGIGVMIFSMAASWLLVWRIHFLAQRTKSLILATEKLHFTTDILANGGIIAALWLIKMTGIVYFDLLISIGIAVYIFKVSFGILKKAVDELLDRSLPPVSKEEIEKLILDHDAAIVGVHNFRSRLVGDKIFMDFHIEIRGEHDFKGAHLKAESVISMLERRYRGSDITVHYDPEGES